MRLALGIEYDGARFHGWQTQPDGCTVQDTLERALSSFAGAPVATVCAGRTDTGVHATGQVVHLDTVLDRPLKSWVRGLNAGLPASIAVRWARVVADDFHARFCARARTYEYAIVNHPVRSPLAAGRAGWVFRPLDAAAMHAAAQALVGRHDFSSFRAAECQAATPVRTVTRLTVVRAGHRLIIRITADAFLQHMVRNIVGALVEVGVQRRPPAWVASLLAACDRTRGAPTFDAAGLTLVQVDYDERFALPTADADAHPWLPDAPASSSVD